MSGSETIGYQSTDLGSAYLCMYHVCYHVGRIPPVRAQLKKEKKKKKLFDE